MEIDYPDFRRDDSVVEELFHGHKVPDPYRWLEDPDSDETREFVKKQNDLFANYIQKSQLRNKFFDKLKDMFNFEKFSCPFRVGEKYAYFYNSGLEAQSSLYIQDTLESSPILLLDPKSMSEDGTSSLNNYSFTESGNMLAYGISHRGSDWVTVSVKTVSGSKVLEDRVEWIKFSGLSWTHDEKGFFYSRYPKPNISQDKSGTETAANLYHKLYYHTIGTSQDQDILIYESKEHPRWIFGGFVSADGKYLLVTVSESTDPVNHLYIAELTSGWTESGLTFQKIVENFDAEYSYITNEGTKFWFKTNLNSPNYKVVSLEFDPSKLNEFVDAIPEKEYPLDFCDCVHGDKLIVVYMIDVKHEIRVHNLKNGEFERTLPIPIGTVLSTSGKKKLSTLFYKFASFIDAGTIYRIDFNDQDPTPKIFRTTKVSGHDESFFKVEQVFYPSKDGTKIPMFIVCRKDMELNGKNPIFLYGYGGFSISLTPGFSASRLIFVKNLGMVLAIPNLRGGGEYGEVWHKKGCLFNKQSVFDDFQAAAEYLIRNKYTNSSNICINGGSNGGLLVGACINQRPDLFQCAIADVGVMDMLRFHKFTIGHAWKAEYGDPEKKEDFEYLLTYSPLHNIAKGNPKPTYPSVLLTTGDHDDRVVPLHSLKYIAELQRCYKGEINQKNPLLIRVETKAGHGAGKPTLMVIEETADKLAFMEITMKLNWKD